ncbi:MULTISPECIES: helix-turn-helix domain-containing protein [Bordetella]|uniref:Transcriptional regulator n=1 Tax=Bordetella genomosp. 6 TaxID=463024 RepID=A0ABX4FIQ1_9BORD|nr:MULTISPECIES: helix-turn-helix transcriptional regulator [Bordetella]AOB28935.1 transcriptional regulator [Bordetella bronchiseptica]ARP74720.1 transcriptional regulator [Bordetella genomosp. 6]AZW46292.1 XRE family transcriptional regulator [Bordetella bronchiseptica]MBN3267189.1 XRE family transcriptional regulator [Bordetella bronchiseptica]OZI80222.1 transcriptional regulator [Bordetella genomosp. 6]
MSQADRLRASMRWRGISSQNQLARISGVPQSTIHRILARGDAYAPTRATLERLARALHTTVPWLSDGMVGTSAAPEPAPSSPDGSLAELQALWARLPRPARRHMLAVVRLAAASANR